MQTKTTEPAAVETANAAYAQTTAPAALSELLGKHDSAAFKTARPLWRVSHPRQHNPVIDELIN